MGTNFPGDSASAAAAIAASSGGNAAMAVEAAEDDPSLGIIPRLVSDVIDGMRSISGGGAAADTAAGGGATAAGGEGSHVDSVRLFGTYLEIYNEVVRDLLREDGVPAPAGGHPLVKDR